jgi:hypothetical protein
MTISTPTPTPAPIPAFSPVLNPDPCDEPLLALLLLEWRGDVPTVDEDVEGLLLSPELPSSVTVPVAVAVIVF